MWQSTVVGRGLPREINPLHGAAFFYRGNDWLTLNTVCWETAASAEVWGAIEKCYLTLSDTFHLEPCLSACPPIEPEVPRHAHMLVPGIGYMVLKHAELHRPHELSA